MHLVLQVLATAQALRKTGERLFRAHGLTLAQFNVLNLLADQPAGMRASQLARALIVDASNVTGLLKRMQAEGLLRDCENTADRRQHVVALTTTGLTAWKAANREYVQSLETVDSALSPAARRITEQALRDMIAVL